MSNLRDLQSSLKYTFKNEDLLKNALCHKSYINEARGQKIESYERLEFLGDAVLGLVIGEFIYDKYPSFPEGVMSKLRASVVCEQTLSDAARDLDMGGYIYLSNGEKASHGYDKDAILCDVFESVIAAIYLDSDMEHAKKFILDNLSDTVEENASLQQSNSDYKSTLQEKVQHNGKNLSYRILSESGPDHEKVYVAAVYVNGEKIAEGIGASKKKAHQDAAKKALEKI